MAKEGTISRVDYATEVMKQEFSAEKKLKNIIPTFGLTPQEVADSYFYNRCIQCPDDFDAFLVYVRKVSPQRDAFKDYENYYDRQKAYYDSLKKTSTGANTP
jgi:hypothetical protein